MNLVPEILGSAVVRSVMVPYLCTRCDAPTVERVEVVTLSEGRLPEPAACARCGERLLLDAIEEHYLAFLRD
jgi:DNA-directed RNA polymerase subunit RPC12/RpoP